MRMVASQRDGFVWHIYRMDEHFLSNGKMPDADSTSGGPWRSGGDHALRVGDHRRTFMYQRFRDDLFWASRPLERGNSCVDSHQSAS